MLVLYRPIATKHFSTTFMMIFDKIIDSGNKRIVRIDPQLFNIALLAVFKCNLSNTAHSICFCPCLCLSTRYSTVCMMQKAIRRKEVNFRFHRITINTFCIDHNASHHEVWDIRCLRRRCKHTRCCCNLDNRFIAACLIRR